MLVNLIEKNILKFFIAILALMLGALRKKEFTASFVEHFKGNHENTICNIQFEDHKHVFQTQNYSSNNMAITSPICQHNRLQNEHN